MLVQFTHVAPPRPHVVSFALLGYGMQLPFWQHPEQFELLQVTPPPPVPPPKPPPVPPPVPPPPVPPPVGGTHIADEVLQVMLKLVQFTQLTPPIPQVELLRLFGNVTQLPPWQQPLQLPAPQLAPPPPVPPPAPPPVPPPPPVPASQVTVDGLQTSPAPAQFTQTLPLAPQEELLTLLGNKMQLFPWQQPAQFAGPQLVLPPPPPLPPPVPPPEPPPEPPPFAASMQ